MNSMSLPTMAVVIAAYNEADCIVQKAHNTLALRYPESKKRVIFVTDGSTDGTPDLLRNIPGVEVFHHPARRGKTAAINRIMPFVDTEITVFTDANTDVNPDALLAMAAYYTNPKIGAVSGEKRVLQQTEDAAAAAGEGLYWKYESWLKKQDAAFYSLAGAAGELFSIRTMLFTPIPPDTLLDDFFLSVSINKAGYRVAYAPDAVALETASENSREEFKRKVRISAGGLQETRRMLPFLFTRGSRRFKFALVSHRLLRWTVAPFALPVVLVLSGMLAAEHPLYAALFVLQVLFYVLALAGWALESKKIRFKPFFVAFYFTMMNIAVYFGAWRRMRGTQTVLWEKARRSAGTISLQEKNGSVYEHSVRYS